MNNQEIAKKVIDALGGRENVNSVAHCATRLRVMVKDEGKINKEVLNKGTGSNVLSVLSVTFSFQSSQLS